MDKDNEETENILGMLRSHYFKDIPYVLGASLIAYELVKFHL